MTILCGLCGKYPAAFCLRSNTQIFFIGICHFFSLLACSDQCYRIYPLYSYDLLINLQKVIPVILQDSYISHNLYTHSNLKFILSTFFTLLKLPVPTDLLNYEDLYIPAITIKINLLLLDLHSFYIQYLRENKLLRYSIPTYLPQDLHFPVARDITSFYKPLQCNPSKAIIYNVTQPHSKEINRICLTSNERYLISSSLEKDITIWDLDTNKELTRLKGHTRSVDDIYLFPDDIHVASCSWDKTVKIWNRRSYREVWSCTASSRPVSAVICSYDGRYSVTGCKSGNLKLWDLHHARLRYTFTGHKSGITCLKLTRNSKILISASRDKSIILWSLSTFNMIATLTGHTSDITCIQLTSDDRFLYSSSYDNTIKVWDMRSHISISTIYLDSITCFSLSKDGSKLAIANSKEIIRVFHLNEERVLYEMKGHFGWISSMLFDSKEKFLVSCSWDRSIIVWKLG
jgi:WD40 repeat protein